MKVLQLCTRVPYPPVDGGTIAMHNLADSLDANGVQVKILAFNTIKQLVKIEDLPSEYREKTQIDAVFLDNRIKPFAALLNLFTGESYNILRFIRRDFEELLVKTLKGNHYDIIQLEGLYMSPYLDIIRRTTKAKVVLRTHNIEHLIWQRLAAAERNPFKRRYLNLLADRLKRYEKWAVNHVDLILALTKEDHLALIDLGCKVPVEIAPVGLEINKYHPGTFPEKPIMFHIGAMDWMPNQEGIKWFCEEVWNDLKRSIPDVEFKIAGRKMPRRFYKYEASGIRVEEYVEDSKAYMNSGSIMIVPLFSGSGMRVKIIEGMALGRAVISTPVGVEGIPVTDKKNVLLASDKEQFIQAVKHLYENPEKIKMLGDEARNLSVEVFDNHKIGLKVKQIYTGLMNN